MVILPVPNCSEKLVKPVAGVISRLKELAITVGVTGAPVSHVGPVRILNVTDVGVTVHDEARYGTSFFPLKSMSRSYAGSTSWVLPRDGRTWMSKLVQSAP